MDSVVRPKILVVEDEVIIAREIALKLKKAGYEVIQIVDSGEAAIHWAKTQRPDLVLMDIVLQGNIDGIEAAASIGDFHIPVVFLTAYADDKTLARAKQTSPFGYVLKPLRNDDFHITIQMALQKAADQTQLRKDRSDLHQEVQHRVFNNLQVLSSMLSLKHKEFDDPQIRSALREIQSWMTAMAIANRSAFETGRVGNVNLYTYLSDLVCQMVRVLPYPVNAAVKVVPLRAITLPLNQAINCGLVVNELLVRLMPMDSSESQPSNLTLTLEQANPQSLTITMMSDAVTKQPKTSSLPPERELLALIIQQLDASLESKQTRKSYKFSLTFPLDE